MIPQDELMRLAEKHEAKENPASDSPQQYRKATCVVCESPMVKMYHCWLKYTDDKGQKWVKEIHLCKSCYEAYEPYTR